LDVPPYVGFSSNLGVLVWWGAAVVSAGSAVLLWRARRPEAGPLLALAVISAAAALDDLFRVHEYVLPALGVPEALAYGLYVVATLGVLWMIRWFLAANEWPMLLVAGVFFAASLGFASWRAVAREASELRPAA
jgi:hypothetical protein